jgi:FtsP/CotA-like multicopper oxidase with cupredoxin domain
MARHRSQDVDPFSITRRRFLALAGGGITLAPFVHAGCQKRVEVGQGQESGKTPDVTGLVLRANAFTAAPDGRSKEIWGYNGQLPGPLLRAKEGEMLRIKVVNELKVPTSVHWHGMHQPGTWQMDGVDAVSRPPIPPGSAFAYEFKATPAGTHWYHSHVGVQYGEGLFGPLIVEERTPIATYDREEILLINDWYLESGDQILAKLLKGVGMKMPGKKEKVALRDKPDVGDVPFQSGLINGKGRAKGEKSPLFAVEVKKGETIRLRLINGSSTYALRFQIDGHPLTVIATDGAPMQPAQVDNLVLGVGERFDVLLKAGQDGAHWIRAATLDGNEIRAVLRYVGASESEPTAAPVRWGERSLSLEQMRAREPVELAEKPREIPFRLGGSMMPYRWDINGQFYPKADPVVLETDEPVRIRFQNPTAMDHPFHLHGHYFHVLGKPGALNLKDPVQKDTVNVPAKSDLVIQWRAINPGRWFFHCHIEWHLAAGMARVMEIKPYSLSRS